MERPRRTGRGASSAELHGPRELSARLPAPFEVPIGRQDSPYDAEDACTACLTHLQRPSRMSAARERQSQGGPTRVRRAFRDDPLGWQSHPDDPASCLSALGRSLTCWCSASPAGERQTYHPLNMPAVGKIASGSSLLWSGTTRQPSGPRADGLYGSGVMDSPSVSGSGPTAFRRTAATGDA